MFDSKKTHDRMSHCKTFQFEKFQGIESDIKEIAKNTDTGKSDGNNLMTKSKVLKSLIKLIILVQLLT